MKFIEITLIYSELIGGIHLGLPAGSSELLITKPENLAIATGTCRPKLVLIENRLFVRIQNRKMQGCQWHEIKRIKSYFRK